MGNTKWTCPGYSHAYWPYISPCCHPQIRLIPGTFQFFALPQTDVLMYCKHYLLGTYK